MARTKEKTRLAIVGSVGIPAKYGGFETLTKHLVKEMSGTHDITVFCSKNAYASEERKAEHDGAKLRYVPLKANGIQSIPYDIISIFWALLFADAILVLGVSGCVTLPLIRCLARKKVIVNIDGLEWRRPKWGKIARWWLQTSEGFAVKYAHEIVTDNIAIQRYVAVKYGIKSRVIAYGGDHVLWPQKDEVLKKKYPFTDQPYFVKVARIEPENNISMILGAFSKMEEELVLIGNWNRSGYGKDLFEKYKHVRNIHLLGPIYNQEELDFIRGNAKAYVHGHEAGGTNPSLVEAMSLGLPVIAYGVSFNFETTHFQACYFSSKEGLPQQIQSLTPKEFELNGQKMRNIADRAYTWKFIASQYEQSIAEVLSGKRSQHLVSRLPKMKKAQAIQEIFNPKMDSLWK